MTIREFDGKTPQIGHAVYIDPSAAVIGDVTLGDDCSVWPMAVLRGDMHRITVGARTSVQDCAVLHITHAGPYNPNGYPLDIGNDVIIGHQATLHGCSVGNEVLVGIGATLMDGCVVEDRVMIGAHTLVPPGKRLESGWLYVGSPARQARRLTDRELEFFRYSAGNYVRLKNRYQGADGGA